MSGALPGSVHDKKAAWIWDVLAELEAAGLVTLADKGYQGAAHAKVPYKGKNKPESQKDANRAHAKLLPAARSVTGPAPGTKHCPVTDVYVTVAADAVTLNWRAP